MPQIVRRTCFILLLIFGAMAALLAVAMIVAEMYFFLTAPTYHFAAGIVLPILIYISISFVCILAARGLGWRGDGGQM